MYNICTEQSVQYLNRTIKYNICTEQFSAIFAQNISVQYFHKTIQYNICTEECITIFAIHGKMCRKIWRNPTLMIAYRLNDEVMSFMKLVHFFGARYSLKNDAL